MNEYNIGDLVKLNPKSLFSGNAREELEHIYRVKSKKWYSDLKEFGYGVENVIEGVSTRFQSSSSRGEDAMWSYSKFVFFKNGEMPEVDSYE